MSKPEPYSVKVNQPQAPKINNYIRTSKYTALTFLPLNLFSQFRRFYNIYFLVAAVFAFYPNASAISPVNQIAPLLFIVLLTMIKDGIEDFFRYLSDRKSNNTLVQVIRMGVNDQLRSRQITAGDIVLVNKNDMIPCDMILLSSAFDDGSCFIETSQLDGETNLKRRMALKETSGFTKEQLVVLKAQVDCESPNNRMNQFEGRIEFDNKAIALTQNQMLLRGASLRNTEYVYGVCVYAGLETKIMKNLVKTGLKGSTLQSTLNRVLIGMFVYNAIILAISIVLSYIWAYAYIGDSKAWYIYDTRNPAETGALQAASYYILYTYVIPISLFISMEVVRVIQAYFIGADEKLKFPVCSASTDGEPKPTVVRNSNLNEELGVIDYIFSDKTGTLTQNVMTLSRWYVNGTVYEELEKPGGIQRHLESENDPKLNEFAHHVAICHSALPVEEKGKLEYESESPDETALLQSMQKNGIQVLQRTKDRIKLDFLGKEESYDLLEVIEFNSDRKRMSVVVRIDGKIYLFCKGADSIIFDRLNLQTQQPAIDDANKQLHNFSSLGLRTLVFAKKVITEEQFKAFQTDYVKASTLLQDREKTMMEVADKFERDMELLGCSAIEDKLQDFVPDTIDYLLQAGIKVWVLTGDKTQTAIQIALSCKLFNNKMKIHILEAKTVESCQTDMKAILQDIEQGLKKNVVYGLAINGECLRYALETYPKEFLDIASKCHSVLCTRVSPLQKSMVVTLVRKNMSKTTLAVGDGANDVSMIQAADVGVGIVGLEGAQAVRAADFAIPQFQCLKRLLTIHGRQNHYRLSRMIFFSLYKNICQITVCFWFGFYIGSSGLQIYQETFLAYYNVIFTSLPPLAMGIFDKDARDEVIEANPRLYASYRQRPGITLSIFFSYIVLPVWHSVVIFFGLYLLIGQGTLNPNGLSGFGYWMQGWLASGAVMAIVMLKACLTQRHWVWPFVATVVLSLLVYIAFMFIVEALSLPSDKGASTDVDGSIITYLYVLLSVVASLLPDLVFMYVKEVYYPNDVTLLRQSQK